MRFCRPPSKRASPRALEIGLTSVLLSLALFAASRELLPHVRAQPAPPHALRSTVPAPPLADFEQRAQRLFDAIVHDDPAQASELFFPRDAFLQVKAMPNPGRYYDKLHARFEQDIHALHKTLARDARYERFELSKRGGYVKPGEEGNRLPYWAARHNVLHYREGGTAKRLEVRVVITWQERWYVIHLREFQ